MWQAEPAALLKQPQRPTEREQTPPIVRLEAIRRRGVGADERTLRAGIASPTMRVHNLGAPLTNEYELAGWLLRATPSASSTPPADLSQIDHMSW